MNTVYFTLAVDIEKVNELYAREEIVKRIRLRLENVRWIKDVTMANVEKQS